MPIRIPTFAALLALLALLPPALPAAPAGDSAGKADSALFQRIKSIRYRTGKVTVGEGLATLDLPPDLKFVGPEDAEFVLTSLWGNPPDNGALGMLFPSEGRPYDSASWGVVIQYHEDGHVKDDDAAKIDYDDLLKKMRKEAEAGNKERAKQGYDPVTLVGWAERPYYDAAAKKLFWAKELRFGDKVPNTLNYNIRVLGRKGVLVLNVVSGMDQFPALKGRMGEIVRAAEFAPGNRYADFDKSTDKVAVYGIAALVAGGVLAKAGFFKLLLVGILAMKKFLIIGAVALLAFFRRLFGGGPKVKRVEEKVKRIE